MKKTVRVGLSFAKLPKDQLNGFAILVIVCAAKNIVLFPNLPVTLAALSALQLAYQDAMNAATVGGRKDTAALKDARNALVSALRQIAAYIQSLNLTEAQVLSSGFDVVIWSKTMITLLAPGITGLDNSVTTQLGGVSSGGGRGQVVSCAILRGHGVVAGRGHLAQHQGTSSSPISHRARSIPSACAPSAVPRNTAPGARWFR